MTAKMSFYTSKKKFRVIFLLLRLIFCFHFFYNDAAKLFMHIMSKFHENMFISFKVINVKPTPYPNFTCQNDIDCSTAMNVNGAIKRTVLKNVSLI